MEKFTICSYCKKVFSDPILLSCCGETICETDLENLYSDSNKKDSIKCPFDNGVVSIPLNGFPVNRRILEILNTDVNNDHAKAKINMKLLFEEINQYEILVNSPENYIYEYFSDIQNKIDLRFELIRHEIDKYHEELTNKISNLKGKCKIQPEGLEMKLNNHKREADTLSENLRIFSADSDKWVKMNKEIEIKLTNLRTDLIELKKKLTNYSEIEIEEPKINVIDLIGKIKITRKDKLKVFSEELKLRNSLDGHSNAVDGIAVLQNGDLATQSQGIIVKIWDLENGKLKYTLEGHSKNIIDITVIQNGDLATCSADKTIKIWNKVNGKLKYTLCGHSSSVWNLTSLQNGDIASGSADNTIKIWDIVNGKLKYTLDGHLDTVHCLAVLQNGDLASGSADKTIKIWDTVNRKLKCTLDGHSGSVWSLTVLHNGDLASGSDDNTIKIWNTGKRNLKYTLDGHLDTVLNLAVLQNGDLASGSADKTIKIWDTLNGKLKYTLYGHSDTVLNLTVLQNGDLASGSSDRTIKIWS